LSPSALRDAAGGDRMGGDGGGWMECARGLRPGADRQGGPGGLARRGDRLALRRRPGEGEDCKSDFKLCPAEGLETWGRKHSLDLG